MNALVAGAVALSESGILVNGMSATDLITGAHVTGEGELVAEPHEVRYRGSPVSVDALTVLRGLVGDLLEQRREFDARQDPNVPVTSVFAPARSGLVERCPWGLGAAVPDVVVVGPYADVVADHLRVTGLRARTVDLAACLRIAAELAEVERELEALAGHPARVGRGVAAGVDGTAAGAAAPAGAAGADGAAGVDGVDDAAAGADAADGTERERSRGDARRPGARAGNVVARVVSRARTGTPVHGRAGMVGTVARPALAVAVAACAGVVVAAVWSVGGGDGASSPTGVAATATTTGTPGAGRSAAAGATTAVTTASPPVAGAPGPAGAVPPGRGRDGAGGAAGPVGPAGAAGTTGVTARSDMPVDVTVPGWRLTDVAGRRETWMSDDPGMRVIVAATNVPVRSQDALDTAVLDALAGESDLTVTGTGPVRYEERFPGSLTAWTVRFIDGAQVSVGCQYREATEERRRACEAVTWTVAKR